MSDTIETPAYITAETERSGRVRAVNLNICATVEVIVGDEFESEDDLLARLEWEVRDVLSYKIGWESDFDGGGNDAILGALNEAKMLMVNISPARDIKPEDLAEQAHSLAAAY